MQKHSKKAKSNKPKAITNRRASFDYNLGEELTVGIVLSGPEVRAARDGHIQLKGSYVNIKNDELWLTGASFSIKINEKNSPSNRTVDNSPRKLLATKRQINGLARQRQAGFTVVPLRLLTGGRFIKLVIAIGKGKKLYDKRQAIKRRDISRDIMSL